MSVCVGQGWHPQFSYSGRCSCFVVIWMHYAMNLKSCWGGNKGWLVLMVELFSKSGVWLRPDESPEVQTEEHATPFVGRDKTGFSLPWESRSSFPHNYLLWPSHGCLCLPLHTRTSVPEARFFSFFSLSSSFPGEGKVRFRSWPLTFWPGRRMVGSTWVSYAGPFSVVLAVWKTGAEGHRDSGINMPPHPRHRHSHPPRPLSRRC